MFLPEFTITQKVLGNIAAIEYSRAVSDSIKILPSWEKQMKKETAVSRISSLMKMEGKNVSEQDIKENLDDMPITKMQEIQNLNDALVSVKELGKKSDLEEIDLKYINQTLTEKLLPKTKQGAYRTQKNPGHPAPHEILAKMVILFDWYNSLDARENHPLISAGIMMAEILRIEPFGTANFSTASLTFDLVLESRSYKLKDLVEIDTYLLNSRRALEEQIQELGTEENDYTAWLEFLTNGFAAKTYNLIEKIKLLEKDTKVAKATGRVRVSERQERIIEYLQDYGILQNKDFPAIFPGVSEDTVLRDLKSLLDKQIIKKTGSTKSSRYEIA